MKHYNQPRLVKHNGYRHTASSTPVTSSVSQVNAAARSVQSQLDQINKSIDEMTVLPFHQAGGGLQDIGQTSSTMLRVCFRCKGEKHIKKLSVTGMDKGNRPLILSVIFVFGWGMGLQDVRNLPRHDIQLLRVNSAINQNMLRTNALS